MAKTDADQELIQQLADLLNQNGLTEIEVETNDRRIRVARQLAQSTVAVAAPAPAHHPVAAPASAAAAAEPAGDLSKHPGAVTSPMVGTAYRSPEPGAQPFVGIGDQVRAGQTVLIIEAMKTFNEIPAPRDGKVKQVLIDDGTPVEFGEVLMIVE
jgi:acetyl-CoA carboxylase biotin carboxyl carrier protein